MNDIRQASQEEFLKGFFSLKAFVGAFAFSGIVILTISFLSWL